MACDPALAVCQGKPVSGLVLGAADPVADDDELGRWVRRGLAFAASQPPKEGL